jgi:hypothetical protein
MPAEFAPPSVDDLRGLAARYGLDDPPTDVEFERYISPDEYAIVMVPCLNELGIPASTLPDGGVGFGDIPADQALAQKEAMYRCEVRYPTHPRFLEPLDDGQLRRLYAYFVDELVHCLEAEGYVVDPPPTMETFVASYSDPESEAWTPYPVGDPQLEDTDEWYRLNQICPQTPPLEDLYGVP